MGSYRVDLATGEIFEHPENPRSFIESFPTRDGGWLDVAISGTGQKPDVAIQRYDSAGQPINFEAASVIQVEPRPDSSSPDGRWLVTGSAVGLTSPAETSIWPAVAMIDLQSKELAFRAVRAALVGRRRNTSWLADSSGVVVATPDGFAILTVQGTLEALPFGPVEQSGVGGVPIPVPAPSDRERFVYRYRGRVVMANRTPLSPEIAATEWASKQPWNDYGLSPDGSELRLVQSAAPGIDGGATVLTAFGLPAHVEYPPFPPEIHLRVDADGEGLNLRTGPSEDAEIITVLPNRAVLTVTDDSARLSSAWPDEASADTTTSFWVYDVPWWVHVRWADGPEGWVRSDFVTWTE